MNIDTLLTRIAREQLGIDTLEIRHSDGLDFHDLSVWRLRDALKAAYDAGREDARKDTKAPRD